MRGRRWAAVGFAATMLALTAVPAAASCAAPEGSSLRQRLRTADTVFVGTVREAASDGRLATVAVDAVWRGDVTGEEVQVIGGETRPGVGSSTDRDYELGRRYLFVPYGGRDGVYRDGACSDTQVWRARYNRIRPKGAPPVQAVAPPPSPASDPHADTSTGGMAAITVGAGLAAVAGAAALALLLNRRRAH